MAIKQNKVLAAVGIPAGIMLLNMHAGNGIAADRQYPIYPLQGAIVMDGRMDEAPWQGAPMGTDFIPLDSAIPPSKTLFRLLYDSEALYLGIWAESNKTNRIAPPQKADASVWDNDCVEFFFQPGADKRYSQFAVSATGKRFSAWSDSAPLPLSAWQGAACQASDSYTLELRIPFSLWSAAPWKSVSSPGNICRTVPRAEAPLYSAWTPLGVKFHEPERFAEFQFRKAPAAENQIERINTFVNLVYGTEAVTRAKTRLGDYDILLQMAAGLAAPDAKAAAVIQGWKTVRAEIERYLHYWKYFDRLRNDPAFWEAEHTMLAGGPPAPLASFYLPLVLDEQADNLKYRLLLNQLLKESSSCRIK